MIGSYTPRLLIPSEHTATKLEGTCASASPGKRLTGLAVIEGGQEREGWRAFIAQRGRESLVEFCLNESLLSDEEPSRDSIERIRRKLDELERRCA